MATSPIGVLDLSIVTGLLVQTLENYWLTSPLWTTANPSFAHNISQLTPDETRKTGSGGSECQVTVALIHIEPNKYNSKRFPSRRWRWIFSISSPHFPRATLSKNSKR